MERGLWRDLSNLPEGNTIPLATVAPTERTSVAPRPKESRMKTAWLFVLISAMCMAQTPDLKPSVTYARSWDAAVAEAKLLNLPIVVHSHGFY